MHWPLDFKQRVYPDPANVKAIKQMAAPKSVTDVRRFVSKCNYLAKLIPNLSATSEPLRCLTEKNIEFQWGSEEQSALERLKDMVCKDQILAFYDVNKPVVIQYRGMRATLLQGGRPVALMSRSLTKAEKNYVALELECLAIVFACSKFDQYINGKKVNVEADHKPLEVITKKSILAAPISLQRMLLALQRYDIEVVYRPGEQQVIADVLSRLPTTKLPVKDENLALLEWRNISTAGLDTRPSQRLFVRRTRGAIPSSEAKLAAKLPQGTWEKSTSKPKSKCIKVVEGIHLHR